MEVRAGAAASCRCLGRVVGHAGRLRVASRARNGVGVARLRAMLPFGVLTELHRGRMLSLLFHLRPDQPVHFTPPP
jgi:hypothetical protein